MTIEFPCPQCAQLVRTPDAAAGKKGKCPSCSAVVTIPAAKSSPPPAARKATEPPVGPIEFFCSSCGQIVRTPRSAAGKKGKCPHCAEIVLIPLVDTPLPAAAKTKQPATAAPAKPTAAKQETLPAAMLRSKTQVTAKRDIEFAPPTESASITPPLTPQLQLPSTPQATSKPAPQQISDPFTSVYANAAPGLPTLPPSSGQTSTAPKPTPAAAVAKLVPLAPKPTQLATINKPASVADFTPLNPITNFGQDVAGTAPLGGLQPLPAASPLASTGTSKGAVNIPAIIQLVVVTPFMVMFLLYLCLLLFTFCLSLLTVAAASFRFGIGGLLSGLASILIYVGLIAAQITVLVGSARQLERRSHLMALIAAWLAVIPCVSPMGMPAAIWSLVVLYRDDVKSSFRS